jgi:hypothetical protein
VHQDANKRKLPARLQPIMTELCAALGETLGASLRISEAVETLEAKGYGLALSLDATLLVAPTGESSSDASPTAPYVRGLSITIDSSRTRDSS